MAPVIMEKDNKKGHTDLAINLQAITCLDLSSNNLETIFDTIILPENLAELNLSNNKLKEIPAKLLSLKNLKVLNLAHNRISYFDTTPDFCNTLERLNLESNELEGPPYWIWSESPKNIIYLNLANNKKITNSLCNGYFEELLQYTTGLLELNIENCGLSNHLELIGTCPKLKVLYLGNETYYNFRNYVIDLPFIGLEKCLDIEVVQASNTNIYSIIDKIDLLKNIVELNVSNNKLHSLPNEFCDLLNLELCVLSCNNLLYLPEQITKLCKLKVLLLDRNELCMIPDGLCALPSLKTLDLYDNFINEIPESYLNLEEFDCAQNYLDEPESIEYTNMKIKLRIKGDIRMDGRKNEVIHSDSEHSTTTDDEEFSKSINNSKENNNNEGYNTDLSENWDSDEYWIPCNQSRQIPHTSAWVNFVKKKIEEGNFCPIDNHIVSIAEQIKYERMCNPPVVYESDGQFDDYSSDET